MRPGCPAPERDLPPVSNFLSADSGGAGAVRAPWPRQGRPRLLGALFLMCAGATGAATAAAARLPGTAAALQPPLTGRPPGTARSARGAPPAVPPPNAVADEAACRTLHQWGLLYNILLLATTALFCVNTVRAEDDDGGGAWRQLATLVLLSTLWGWGLYGAALVAPAAPALLLSATVALIALAALCRDRGRSVWSATGQSACLGAATAAVSFWALPHHDSGAFWSCPAVWDDAVWLLISFFILLPVPCIGLLCCALAASLQQRARGICAADIERVAPCCAVTSSEEAERLRASVYGGGECAICFDDLKLGDTLRVLPCQHVFHAACLDPWLLTQAVCPTCRAGVASAPPPPRRPPGGGAPAEPAAEEAQLLV